MMSETMSKYEREHAATPNSLPSEDALVEHLLPRLAARIRESMQPLVAEVNQSMRQTLKDHSDEVALNVMPQVAVVVRVTETIDSWLRNLEFGALHPRPQ